MDQKMKRLLEAAKAAREAMRGKDWEHIWVNYPEEHPVLTLGEMLDAAIRECENCEGGKS